MSDSACVSRSDQARGEILSRFAYFSIRTQAGTADAVAFLKQAVADLDPQLPVTIQPLMEEVSRLTERPRFLAWLLSAFAGLALLLAAAGIYGVASYLVTQRTRDIGVRIALGAAPADTSRQVVGEAGRWIAAGAVLGCALAWAGTKALEAQLFGVGSRDLLSWIAALGGYSRGARRSDRSAPRRLGRVANPECHRLLISAAGPARLRSPEKLVVSATLSQPVAQLKPRKSGASPLRLP